MTSNKFFVPILAAAILTAGAVMPGWANRASAGNGTGRADAIRNGSRCDFNCH